MQMQDLFFGEVKSVRQLARFLSSCAMCRPKTSAQSGFDLQYNTTNSHNQLIIITYKLISTEESYFHFAPFLPFCYCTVSQ